MRRSLLGLALLLGWVSTAPAQDIEFFGGYSYLRTPSTTNSQQIGLNGLNASVTANLGSFGLVADLSNYYGASLSDYTHIGSGGRGFTYLFGPQYSFRFVPRVAPFVHALFGAVNGAAIVGQAVPAGSSYVCPAGGVCPLGGCLPCQPCPAPGCSPIFTFQPQHAFTVALGGGIDVKARNHVWIRLAQIDYLHQNFSAGATNTPRFSAGLVYRFGRN